jgi:hypothetical protein
MTEIETQAIKAELDNNCTCEVYDDETGEPILNEYGYPKQPEYCFGECWTDSVYDFTECLLKPYLAVKGWELDTPIKVVCGRMTWTNSRGYAYTTPEKLIDTLTLNGDFRLVFEFDGENLTAVRYSHDEPVGTGKFEFELSDESYDE